MNTPSGHQASTPNHRLPHRRVGAFVVVLVLAALATLAWKTFDDRQKERALVSDALQLRSQSLASEVNVSFISTEQTLSYLAQQVQALPSRTAQLDLRDKLLHSPFLQDLRFYGVDNTLLARGALAPLESRHLPDWLLSQQAQGRQVGLGGAPGAMAIFRTVVSATGAIQGTFLATFDPNYFQGLAEQIPGITIESSFLLGPANELLLDMAGSSIPSDRMATQQLIRQIDALAPDQTTGLLEIGNKLVFISQLRNQPIRLVLSISKELAFERWNEQLVHNALMAAGLVLAAGLFLWHWLRAAHYSAAAADAIHELQQEQQRLIKSIPVGVYKYRVLACGEDQFDYVSERMCQDLGLQAADLLSDAKLAFEAYQEQDIDRLLEATAVALATDGHMVFEGRLKGAPAHPRWMRLESVLTRQDNGDQVWDGVQSNITERKQTEAALQTKNLLLLRSNAELEQFSYSISHDMRQPLRMISSYLQLLQKDLGDTLDDEKRKYFNFAIDGAKRMDAMMLGLLEYSRVGRKGEPTTWVDSRALLDEALLFLRPLVAEAQAELHISGEWPRLFASPDELLRLLQNLVGNALKFRVHGRVPQITLDSTVSSPASYTNTPGGTWQVSIADNGVGMAPDQMSRLFQVFQRLQSRAAYEGTGIGLALCRKIVEHHGGSIRAESEGEGLGSRFTFSLPMANNAPDAALPKGSAQQTARKFHD
jgi:signal transduction histidine kinase